MLHAGPMPAALAIAAAATLSLARCDRNGEPKGAPSKAEGDESAIEWDAPIEVARGPAYAGPWRMNESSFLYVDDAAVALGDGDTAGVAWVDNSRKDLFFRSYTRHGRPRYEIVNVSKSPDVFSWLPRVIVEKQWVFLLWQEIVFSGGSHGGEIFFAHSGDGGRSFSTPVNLSNSVAGDGKGQHTREHWHNGSLDLLRLDDGTLAAAWTTYEGSLLVSRSIDRGVSWSPPANVSRNDALPARAPALAASSTGTVYLAWAVGRDPSAGIRLVRSSDGGQTFAPLGTPSGGDAGGYADAPKLAVDARGRLHLTYTVSLDGYFGPYQVRYARTSHAGDFEPARIIAGPPASEHGASFPSMALDDRGHVYIAWEHHPESGEPARGLGFAYSSTGGDSFERATVPATGAFELGINGSRQGKLTQKLAASAAGRIALVDTRFQDGERSVVRLIMGSPSSSPPAPAPWSPK